MTDAPAGGLAPLAPFSHRIAIKVPVPKENRDAIHAWLEEVHKRQLGLHINELAVGDGVLKLELLAK